MGVIVTLRVNDNVVEAAVTRIIRSDGTDAFLVEVEGEDIRRAGIDVSEFGGKDND